MFESTDIMVSAQVTNEAIFLQRFSGLLLIKIVEKHSFWLGTGTGIKLSI